MALLTVHKLLFGAVVLVFGSYALIALSRWAAGDAGALSAAMSSLAAVAAALLYLRWLSRRPSLPRPSQDDG